MPNLLTGGRLLLAIVFFGMLSYYQYEGRGDPWFLSVAFVVYLVALITDFLDGYLARRWKVEGTFGRVVDPFVDKVLVLGSFIFFAGKNFIIPGDNPGAIPRNVQTITGVVPWMVVLILGRELLVTSLRALSESAGKRFGADFSGKLKMIFQSITVLVILVYVNHRAWLHDHDLGRAARIVRDGFIWGTLVITVVSSFTYVQRAIAAYRAGGPATPDSSAPPTRSPGNVGSIT
ncbi:MAG: CDP-alcohol phosphatidyltransferase family protein [Phycisphaeraceae bacterium]|nr:CDP-alcohol phosphatidyltransferase family protein [Phycisphaeraceae bacterium]